MAQPQPFQPTQAQCPQSCQVTQYHDEMEIKEVKGIDMMMMNELWAEMEGWKWMDGMMKGHFVHVEQEGL